MTWKTSLLILITSLVVIGTPVFADASVFDGTLKKYTSDGQYKIDMTWEPVGPIKPDTQYVFDFQLSDASTEKPIREITFELSQILGGELIGKEIKTSSSENISTMLSFDKPGFLHLVLSDINNSDQEIDFSFPVVSDKKISENQIQYVSKASAKPQMYFCGFEKNVITLTDCFDTETYQDYGWFGKINVLIYAPGWNDDSGKIDRIGDTETDKITVHSRSDSGGNATLDKCDGFVETGENTGLFVGRLKLSGHDHDLNGNGSLETKLGGTSCKNSPLDEYAKIESGRNGGVTVEWQYADDPVEILSKSATFGWTLGTIEFLQNEYTIDDTIQFKFYDLDLYKIPEDKMTLTFKVWSDSDLSGIAIETGENYKFKEPFEFTISADDKSQRDVLHAQLGDSIYVEYEDYTLPVDHEGKYGGPFSKNDDKSIIAQTTLSSEPPPKITLR